MPGSDTCHPLTIYCLVFMSCNLAPLHAFTLLGPANEGPDVPDLFSLMNLCPLTDCGPIERQLECVHQDRYITEMEFMGQICSGCPACRDYDYFVSLSTKTLAMAGRILLKMKQQTTVVAKVKTSAMSLEQKIQQTPYEEELPHHLEQIIDKLLQKFHSLTEDSALLKASRYLEENVQELQNIIEVGAFEESRLDINTHGFYGHFWQPSVLQYDINLLPIFDSRQYLVLLNDRLLDKSSELGHLVERLKTSTSEFLKAVANLKVSSSREQIQDLEQKVPLMLRRIYQLLESSQDVFKAVTAIDINDLESLAEIYHDMVTKPSTQKDVSEE